jgi:hypothetical protein
MISPLRTFAIESYFYLHTSIFVAPLSALNPEQHQNSSISSKLALYYSFFPVRALSQSIIFLIYSRSLLSVVPETASYFGCALPRDAASSANVRDVIIGSNAGERRPLIDAN